MRKTLLFLLLSLTLLATSACTEPVVPQTPQKTPIDAGRKAASPLLVYYGGPGGRVLASLKQAKTFQLTTDQTRADVLIFNGSDQSGPGVAQSHPTEFDLSTASMRLRQGAGIVLLIGPDLTAGQLSDVVGKTVNLELRKDPLSLVKASGANDKDPLLTDIIWTSSPQVRDRWRLTDNAAGFKPLVNGYEDGSMVLGFLQVGLGRLYVFTSFLKKVLQSIKILDLA
jgi:hypothetical protein